MYPSDFYGIHTEPSQIQKIMCQCFMAQTQWNVLDNPQVTPDAKTQVQHNMHKHAFYGIHNRPTPA
jgi:hypothetical protein